MLVYRFLRLILPVILRIFYREVSVHGRRNLISKGPLLVVANHPNTLLDPIIVATVLKQRAGFIAKGTFFNNKIVGAILRFFQVIPVYRKIDDGKNPTDADNQLSFQKSYEFLAKGGTIILFPEGTRTPVGSHKPYRKGGARLAGLTQATVLPVAHNAGHFWPRNSFLKYPGLITVSIGPAIPSHGKSGDQLHTEVESWIEGEMRRIDPESYKAN